MTFWLHRFRKLDVRQKSHRKMLIDTFINAIFLYDDKMVITFNYKEGTTIITFDDLKAALDGKNMGSDLDCLTAPLRNTPYGTKPRRNTARLLSWTGCFFVVGADPLRWALLRVGRKNGTPLMARSPATIRRDFKAGRGVSSLSEQTREAEQNNAGSHILQNGKCIGGRENDR